MAVKRQSQQTALERLAQILEIEEFSAEPGERAVQFMSHLPAIHGQAAKNGEPIGLLPWEENVVRQIYGAMAEDGGRQYRTVYIEIPRKNGKSTFSAMLLLHSLLTDREPAGEAYSVAYTAKQARIVFQAAVNMLRRFPKDFVAMDSKPSKGQVIRASTYYGTIENLETGTTYEVLAANKAGNYGYNPHMVVFDELHVQKSRILWDVMRSAMGAREEPLMIAITTAGDTRESICWEVHEYAERLLSGEIEDPTFLPLIYAAEKDADWRDPEVWAKANPSLGTTVRLDFLQKEYEYAQEVPAAQNSFKREYLNIWTEQTTRWLDVDSWLECAGEVDLEGHEAKRTACYGGLDLSSTTDLTALALAFPDGDGGYDTWFRFWMPEARIADRERKDGLPFRLWAEQGFIQSTPGNVIDYDFIRADMNDLGERFAFQEVGFDPWNATQLSLQLNGDGFTMAAMRQGHQTLNEPSKLFEALVVSKQLRHPNSPVMNWMIGNVEINKNSTGAIRPVKPKDEFRNVDGVQALVMALGRAMLAEEHGSAYETEELLVL